MLVQHAMLSHPPYTRGPSQHTHRTARSHRTVFERPVAVEGSKVVGAAAAAGDHGVHETMLLLLLLLLVAYVEEGGGTPHAHAHHRTNDEVPAAAACEETRAVAAETVAGSGAGGGTRNGWGHARCRSCSSALLGCLHRLHPSPSPGHRLPLSSGAA